jgi:hypothetical protein
MVRELEVPIVTAGGATLMAEDDFHQIPMHAAVVRAQPLHELGDVQDGRAPACEAIDGKARAGVQLLAKGSCADELSHRNLRDSIFDSRSDGRSGSDCSISGGTVAYGRVSFLRAVVPSVPEGA